MAMSEVKLQRIEAKPPEGAQMIIGQAHFIKTVEDLYEALATSSTVIKFGLGFCESSGPCLVRHDGNDESLANLAAELAFRIGAGHVFVILMREAFPISILNKVKMTEEVATVFCATGNPVSLLIAEDDTGRGVLGVIDGARPIGIETEQDRERRHEFLRKIGYKR